MKRRILSVIVAVIMNCILLQGSVSYAREPVAKGGLPASASYSPGSYEAVDESAVYSFKNAGSGLMLDVYGQPAFPEQWLMYRFISREQEQTSARNL